MDVNRLKPGVRLGTGSTWALAGFALTGPVVAVIVAGRWSDGLRWTLYMMASAAAASLIGLIFGVPRARTDTATEGGGLFTSNSNLEQISDWLTKLLVGAGLVQLGALPGMAARVGNYLGSELDIRNAEAFALSSVLYGLGLGFVVGYLWVRLRLRTLLERSEAEAEATAAETRGAVVDLLREATQQDDSGATPPEETLERVASRAVRLRPAADSVRTPRLLWVDDRPSNNTALVRALRDLGIRVDIALSTAEGMRQFGSSRYDVVITDLGRNEDGEERPMAGLELIQRIRARGSTVPILVYAGRRGIEHRDDLIRAGADRVTNRSVEIFEEASRSALLGV